MLRPHKGFLMIIISFNIGRFGIPYKKLVLKRLSFLHQPRIILIGETIREGAKIKGDLSNFLKG
jgi:hypothetical protein